ncbi:GNAT family N-acetyltransferase [Salinicoccus kekensis]|nr:GNAT family N-acetyltransferase [Salinicoccus kekensis]
MGAYKGTFGKRSLDPESLETAYTAEESSSNRIRVTRFKREALDAAAGGAAEAEQAAAVKSPAVDLKTADRDIRPAAKKAMDIYFTKDYVKVNELIENGEGKFFEIKSKYGHVTHSAIKREIHTTINGEKYYDLISPYGYGGPVIHESTNKEKLMSEFEDCFSVYCANNNIVSEFIRFHPIFQNQEDFKGIYDTMYLRQTVGTDFIKFEDTFQNEFSRTARTKVRKRLRDDRFSFHIDRGFKNVEPFIDIYNLTMERHNATQFYYFNREYFYALKDKFGDDLMTISVKFEDKIIAMGLYFLSGDVIHDHLNGTNPDYLEYSPAYLLKYASMKWGVENGYSLIHYGGGVSNAEDDPVLHFKKRFSKHTEFEFHIGKKIWDREVYDTLCDMRGMDKNRDFFPAYR